MDTKQGSTNSGGCNSHWDPILWNASCGDINVELNWNRSLEMQVGISGNLFFKMFSNLINW